MSLGFNTQGTNSQDVFVTGYSANEDSGQTVSMWVYSDGTYAANNNGRLMDKLEISSQEFTWWTGGGIINIGRWWTTSDSRWSYTPPSGDAWHHMLFTQDDWTNASNAPVVYIDGSSATLTPVSTGSGSLVTSSDKYCVGNREGGNNRVFDGFFCDVAMWDRVLSADEIARLAAGQRALTIPSGRVLYYPMLNVDDETFEGGAPSITGALVQDLNPPVTFPARMLMGVG